MAELLIHWGNAAISAMAPPRDDRVVGGRFPRPEETFETEEAAGRWLKTQLTEAHLSGRRVAVILPRSEVVMRKLSLPEVSDNELPDLVRMQAATKSSVPLDQTRIDFVPISGAPGQRTALLATANTSLIEAMTKQLRAAGLEIASIGVAPFATARQLCAAEDSALILAVDGTTAEITLFKNGEVWFSHGTDLSGKVEDRDEDRQWLTSEISRALVAADHLSGGDDLTRLILLGPNDLLGPLTGPLEERFGCGVELLSNCRDLGLEEDSGIPPAPLVAMMGQAEPDGVPRIDFLNPRRRVEKTDHTQLIRGLLIGGLTAAVLIAYGIGWWQRRGIYEKISKTEDKVDKIESTLSDNEEILAKRDIIKSWLTDEAARVGQFVALRNAMPGTDRVYLTEITLIPGGRRSQGRVTGSGRARSRADVAALTDSWETLGYQVPQPKWTGVKEGEYPRSFEFDLTKVKPVESKDSKT